MHTISFEGHDISYDAKALKSWKVQKKLARGGADTYDAVDIILCGKSDEVAALLDDDADKMMELLTAIGSISSAAKN